MNRLKQPQNQPPEPAAKRQDAPKARREVGHTQRQLAVAATLSSPFLTLDEAAAYARCSKRSLQRWLKQGQLSRCGNGRRTLVKAAELHALLCLNEDTEGSP